MREKTADTGSAIAQHQLAFPAERMANDGGQIVETCAAAALHQAQHPYTRGLLASLPRVGDTRPRLPVLTRDPAWLSS